MATIKTVKKVTGIPNALVAVSSGTTNLGASQVVVFLSAVDAYKMAEVVSSLRLSSAEARDLAVRLVAAADKGDEQAAKENG